MPDPPFSGRQSAHGLTRLPSVALRHRLGLSEERVRGNAKEGGGDKETGARLPAGVGCCSLPAARPPGRPTAAAAAAAAVYGSNLALAQRQGLGDRGFG